MISVNDFKTGLTVEVDGDIFTVLDFQHVKPGKGAAFVRSKLKNLRNGNTVERTFRAGETIGRAIIENRGVQYLYASGSEHAFMDNETYDQFELSSKQLEWELNFLKENMTVNIISYQGEILGINLPTSVELKVVETEPGVKEIQLKALLNRPSLKQVILYKFLCSSMKEMCCLLILAKVNISPARRKHHTC